MRKIKIITQQVLLWTGLFGVLAVASSIYAGSNGDLCTNGLRAEVWKKQQEFEKFLENKHMKIQDLGNQYLKVNSSEMCSVVAMGPMHIKLIKYLRLDGNFDRRSLQQLKRFRRLVKLDLALCDKLADEDLEYITQCTPTIRELSLGGHEEITDESIKIISKNYPQLAILDLAECTQITDQGLKDLPKELKVLLLMGCEGITDQGLRYLPAGICGLDLAYTSITDEGLQHLLRLPLARLDLKGCPNLTKKGTRCLCKLPNLELVSLSDRCLENGAIKPYFSVSFE